MLLVCALTSPDFITTTIASNKHLYLKKSRSKKQAAYKLYTVILGAFMPQENTIGTTKGQQC